MFHATGHTIAYNMESEPAGDQAKLLHGQGPRKQLTIDTQRSPILTIVNMDMGFVMSFVIKVHHLDHDSEEPADFRHMDSKFRRVVPSMPSTTI